MGVNRGAVAAILGAVQERRKRKEDLEDDRRDFDQRMQLAGITAAVRDGTLSYDPTTRQFQTPTQEATGLLNQQLPQTPYVKGPGGSFLTSANVEAAPGYTVPRQQVIQQTAPALGQQILQQRQNPMRPVYSYDTGSQDLSQVGMVPKNALIRSHKSIGGLGGMESEMVTVQAANGDIVDIPRENLQEALRRGATLIQ